MPTITVTPYNLNWPRLFVELRAPIWEAVGDVAVAIEHVGSTSVPGLAAKPIIDMTIVVAGRERVPAAIERLARLGYVHAGDRGIACREAFDNPPGLPAHHLYLCPQNSAALANHLIVRDYLRTHADVAREYAALKLALAARFPNDIDGYVAGKTDLIVRILAERGMSEAERTAIERANKQPALGRDLK